MDREVLEGIVEDLKAGRTPALRAEDFPCFSAEALEGNQHVDPSYLDVIAAELGEADVPTFERALRALDEGDLAWLGFKAVSYTHLDVYKRQLVVFVLALAALGAIAFSYWEGQHSYDSLAEEAFDAPEDVAGTSLADLTVDWDALRAINPYVVGWIYVPGTKVNYPIMHSGDDETYLTRDFYGNEGGWWMADYGAVFLSGGNRPDFTDTNNIVYGHNLLNGSMFADIAGMADESAYDGHRTVYVLTPQGSYRLTSFALVNVFANDPLVQTSFASPEDFAAYVQDKIDRSICLLYTSRCV